MPTLIILLLLAVVAVVCFIINQANQKSKIVKVIESTNLMPNKGISKEGVELITKLKDIANIKHLNHAFCILTTGEVIYIGEGEKKMFDEYGVALSENIHFEPNSLEIKLIWTIINQHKQTLKKQTK